eukprot:gene9704-biopygen15271
MLQLDTGDTGDAGDTRDTGDTGDTGHCYGGMDASPSAYQAGYLHKSTHPPLPPIPSAAPPDNTSLLPVSPLPAAPDDTSLFPSSRSLCASPRAPNTPNSPNYKF